MRKVIRFTRICGLTVSIVALILLEIFARPVTQLFLSTSNGSMEAAAATVVLAATFLRIRCIASPFAFMNYSSSYCMQAMGNGLGTMIHAIVRQVVFYMPFMYILDKFFGANGLAAALPAGELCGGIVALILVHFTIKKAEASFAKKNGSAAEMEED